MIRRAARAAVAVAAVGLALSCFGGAAKKRVMSPAEQRAGSIGMKWASLPGPTRQALERGDVWLGASEAEAFVAKGEPRLWWNSYMQERWCRVLVHTAVGDVTRTDTSVMTCDGVVVAVTAIAPSLPCWRLAEVGPRIVAAAEYFDRLGIERQWQIVAGILARGQDEQDVLIALGKPYSRGFDEREDGSRADQLVFLDHGGDSYGLSTTLIKGKLAAWRVPAERRLTPEAEQRRLDALENRLTAKLDELDANAKRRHAETIELFNEVMTKQDVMLAALTAPPPQPAGGGGGGGGGEIDGGGGGGGGGGIDGGGGGGVGPNVTGQTELTINDCTYTDTPQGSLGMQCGGDTGVGCPSSYTCYVMGADLSSSGVCVPQAQSDACSKAKGYKTIGGKCKRDRDCDGAWEGFECVKGKGEKSGYCRER